MPTSNITLISQVFKKKRKLKPLKLNISLLNILRNVSELRQKTDRDVVSKLF